MSKIDDIIDSCSIQTGGVLPTKGDVGTIPLTGGENYDSSLRQFSKEDWMGYSDCEDSNPLIANLKNRKVSKEEWVGELIVDGPTVCAFFECDIGTYRNVWCYCKLDNKESAIAVAKAILGMSTARRQWGLVKNLMQEMFGNLPKEKEIAG